MSRTLAIWVLSGLFLSNVAVADPLPPLRVSRERGAWERQRPEILSKVLQALGADPRPSSAPAVKVAPEPGAVNTLVETWTITNPAGGTVNATFTRPSSTGPDRRVATIILIAPAGAPWRADLAPATLTMALVGQGFAVLLVGREDSVPSRPWMAQSEGRPWLDTLRADRLALEALLARPEVDPRRVGVLGLGPDGLRALWLMALDERVACGVFSGGLTRISDLMAAPGSKGTLAPWAEALLMDFDQEAILALCAPRHVQLYGGDRDPDAPESGLLVFRDTAKRVYGLPPRNAGFSFTLFGDDDGGFTPLRWMGAVETFDKAFSPQGPVPLGHAPEPEPKVDASFIDPAESSIAGWVEEKSQRPETWKWHEGVITCDPGANEYGWLRLPVELDDFTLQLEWRVRKGGNTGVFLRAKPVEWFLPPSEKNKDRVASLGLTWPSRTGLELQAQDDAGHADKYSSGSLYRHAAPAANPTLPPLEWNRYTVRCRGDRVEVWSNGQQVLDTRLVKSLLLPNPPLRGFIGLQNHGVWAEFRKIRYRHESAESP